MSAEGFEESRIQNPDEAHGEANMLKAQVEAVHTGEEELTAEDYDAALAVLEQLEEEVHSPVVEGAIRPLRDVASGITALSANTLDLLGWSLLSILPMPQSIKNEAMRAGAKLPREKVVELIRGLGAGEGKIAEDYETLRTTFATAREVLERRRIEAEGIAKR